MTWNIIIVIEGKWPMPWRRENEDSDEEEMKKAMILIYVMKLTEEGHVANDEEQWLCMWQ